MKYCALSNTTVSPAMRPSETGAPAVERKHASARAAVRSRRGMALIVVMVAISASLVLTLALLRTQSTTLQMSRNGSTRDLALQAAQTGAAVALESLQSPEWGGLDQSIARTVFSDGDGTASFLASFEAYEPEDLPWLESAFYVRIDSLGTWQTSSNPNSTVERQVQLLVRLDPRLPGRTILPGDWASASDVAANSGDYDSIQNYALYSHADVDGTATLIMPGARVDGNLWMDQSFYPYQGVRWGLFFGWEYMQSVRDSYVVNGVRRHPHPLAGRVTFRGTPYAYSLVLMTYLSIPYNSTPWAFNYPTQSLSDWQTYQLYDGGPQYSAVVVPSVLSNATLRPTATNPLGIFYRSGDIKIRDDVTIQGTLVTSGDVELEGERVHISAFNYCGAAGDCLVVGSTEWPRMPAIVADNLLFDEGISTSIEGAIILRQLFAGELSDFAYANTADVYITGTAISSPDEQPLSVVELQNSPDLSAITSDRDYAIWLERANTGSWHPIVGVDGNSLTVVGEVKHASPTNYVIRRSRNAYLDIRGPVAASSNLFAMSDTWDNVSHTTWNALESQWDQDSFQRQWDGLPPIPLHEWLADPANFEGWSYPYSTYGLKLEPTAHVSRKDSVRYRWKPPLFAPYTGTGANAPHAGYRWQVISWKEVP